MSRTIELQDDEIAIIWCVDDVLEECKWLNREQAREVLHYLDNKHDATIGINWDTISHWAEWLYPEGEADV